MRRDVYTSGAFVTGVFVAVGIAVGLIGFLSMRWARVQFITAASGASPGEFGPVFVAFSFFQLTVTLFVLGPTLGGLAGALAGSRLTDVRRAGAICAGSSFVGFLLLAVIGLGVASLALSGAGTGQTYSLGSAVVPTLLVALVTGAIGGLGGVLGVQTT